MIREACCRHPSGTELQSLLEPTRFCSVTLMNTLPNFFCSHQAGTICYILYMAHTSPSFFLIWDGGNPSKQGLRGPRTTPSSTEPTSTGSSLLGPSCSVFLGLVVLGATTTTPAAVWGPGSAKDQAKVYACKTPALTTERAL